MFKDVMKTKILLLALVLGLTACASKPQGDVSSRVPADSGDSANFGQLAVPEDNEEVVDDAADHNHILTPGYSKANPNCGGTTYFSNINGKLWLQIRNSTCANVITHFGQYKLDGSGNSGRYKDLEIYNNPGTYTVYLGSNKFVESNRREGLHDVITIQVPGYTAPVASYKVFDIRNGSYYNNYETSQRLNSCGGTLKAKVAGGAVNLIITNTRCTKFDILKDEGQSTDYASKPIPNPASSSFTIPKRYYNLFGWSASVNTVLVKFYDQNGRSDKVLVKFNVSAAE